MAGTRNRAEMVFCTTIARNYVPYARALTESIQEHHEGARVVALILDDEEATAAGYGFETLHPSDLALDPAEYRRLATIYDVLELATAVKPWLLERLLEEGAEAVTYLDPDIQVFAPMNELAGLATGHGIVLTPHTLNPMPRDGHVPDEPTILQSGIFNLGFVSVGRDARPFLEWWRERLLRDCLHAVEDGLFVDQRWIDFVPRYFDHTVVEDPGYNVAYWNLAERDLRHTDEGYTANGRPLRFFHFSGFDPRRPHILSRFQGPNPRILLGDHPVVARLCGDYAACVLGHDFESFSSVPYGFGRTASGVVLDRDLRRAYRSWLIEAERAGDPVPEDVFSSEGEARFAAEMRARMRDVPLPEPKKEEAPAPDEDTVRRAARPAVLRPGVNLVGYFRAESGVGEAVRLVAAALERGGVAYEVFPWTSTQIRQQHEFRAEDGSLDFDTNIICINADELPRFIETEGHRLPEGAYTIGMWSWEVDAFPAEMALAASHVDEIWAPSEHAAAAIRSAVEVPVFSFPHPVLVPQVPDIPRSDLELPDGFLFLFCFDFWSVFDRKNPLAVIEAFSRAFASGEGPRLVIKTVGGEAHPLDLDRLRLAADARPDVYVLDGYVTREQTLAMIASCDAYVSLHRAEGFGLTMAEAMANAKPVVATAYSGNLEFMNEENSFLVPYELAPVPLGNEPYPTTANWAEPDVEKAASILRAIWERPADAREKGGRARGDILNLHNPEARLPFVLGRLTAAGEERRRRQAERELPLTISPLEHASTLTEKDADLNLPARYGFLSRSVRRLVRRATNLFLWHEKDIDRALIDSIRELQDRVAEVGRGLDRQRSLEEEAQRSRDELIRLSEMMADDEARRALLRDEMTELQARVAALANDPTKRTTVTVQTDVGPLRLPAYDRVIVPWMEHHGAWEPEVVGRLREWLAPGMVAVDLGAHVGYHTILMSRLVGPTGRVIALEPEPENFSQLQANIQAAGVTNVDAHPVAAVVEPGSITLHLSDDNSGDHSVSYRAGARTVSVPGVALDDLLGDDARIDVVKSDLQGADHLGLRGMERTLKRCKPRVVVEFWPEGIAATGDDPVDVIRYYRSLGLSIRALEDGSLPIGAAPESIVEFAQARREGFCTLLLAPRP